MCTQNPEAIKLPLLSRPRVPVTKALVSTAQAKGRAEKGAQPSCPSQQRVKSTGKTSVQGKRANNCNVTGFYYLLCFIACTLVSKTGAAQQGFAAVFQCVTLLNSPKLVRHWSAETLCFFKPVTRFPSFFFPTGTQ